MLACADFETTTDINDCRVWAYSICEIGNIKNFEYGNSLEDFMCICANKYENHTFYFHNLAHDGEFIFYWLFRNGYELVKDRKSLENKTFCTLISDMGQFYSIEVCFSKEGHKNNKVIFLDSLKILNFSVEKIAQDFHLPITKLKIDYKEYREIGHILTQNEINYIRNDVEIMSRALYIMFEQGMNKMTIGSDALAEYKSLIGKSNFKQFFPILDYELDKKLRKSYHGGFTYCDKRFQNKEIGEGIVLDVNSLYPSRMYECPMPYGEPVYYKGKYKKDKLYNLYIQKFKCQFELKKNHIPTIQIKTLSFIPTEYLESSGDEEPELTMTNVDLELFLEQYNVYNMKYIEGWKFKSSTDLFKKYVEKWINVKIQSKKDGNFAMYKISKLMLNSLYGKFSLNPAIRSKFPTYNKKEDFIHYVFGEWEERQPIYIPIGTFITSYARYKTITSAQKVYNRFMYADTDSLHLQGLELPEELDIDDYRLGAWKNEFVFDKAKYLRQKSYMEYGKEPGKDEDKYWKITCAGMPKSCYAYVNFENFRVGSKFEGKLQRKRVSGGVILKNVDFTLKK